MSKLPEFHKIRLETHGFRFYSAKETKEAQLDMNPGDFLISHRTISQDSFPDDQRIAHDLEGVPIIASYHDGRIYISNAGENYSAPIGSIPMVSVLISDIYRGL